LDGLFSPDDQLGLLADLLKRQQPGYVPPGIIQGVQIQPQPQQQVLPVSPEIQGNAPAPPPMQPQTPREVLPPSDAILPEDVPPPAAPGLGLIDPRTMALPSKNQGLLGDFQGKWGKEIDQFTPSTVGPSVPAPSEPVPMQAPTRGMPVLPEKKGGISKWMESDTMPLSLALMQAGAGLLTPTPGKSFTAGLAQGLGGFSQGLLSGAQMQALNRKKEMESLKNQVGVMKIMQDIEDRTPREVEYGGKKYIKIGNKLTSLDKKDWFVQSFNPDTGQNEWQAAKPGLPAPLPKEKKQLVKTVGSGGQPQYSWVSEGQEDLPPAYEKPEKPEKPEKAVKRLTTVYDDKGNPTSGWSVFDPTTGETSFTPIGKGKPPKPEKVSPFQEYLRNKQQGGKIGSTGTQTPTIVDKGVLQTNYQQRMAQVQTMPDGPQKQMLTQELNAWRQRHLGE